jgi:hypothetical protein
VVLAVPSREGLELARTRIRDFLGWKEVRHQLKDQDVDPLRQATLTANWEAARKKIPEAVLLMYGIIVTVSDKNEVQAFKMTVNPGEPLFNQIKKDVRSRIQDTPVNAEALLPEGPFNLWRSGDTSRRVKDLVGAFAQFPHLPKMLQQKEILATLLQGGREGTFVLRVTNPDRTVRTFWRQEPDEAALKDPSLEVVQSEAAELTSLPWSLLLPQALPGLWTGQDLAFRAICDYFAGGKVVQVPRQGYEEPVVIPKADRPVIESAIGAAVQEGKLWLTCRTASLCGETVPAGVLTEETLLQMPPTPIPATDLLPETIPSAWDSDTATGLTLLQALSQKAGKPLAWTVVRTSLDAAFQTRLLERTVDSGAWPCDLGGAVNIRVRQSGKLPQPPILPPHPLPPGVLVAEADLRPNQLQDLADQLGELTKVVVGYDLKLHVRLELAGKKKPPADLITRLNALLEEVVKGLRFGGPGIS